MHLCGYSPLCMFIWFPAWEEVNLHRLHLYGFSPLCVLKCVLKLPTWEDTKSHWLHLFDFSPVCIFKSIPNFCPRSCCLFDVVPVQWLFWNWGKVLSCIFFGKQISKIWWTIDETVPGISFYFRVWWKRRRRVRTRLGVFLKLDFCKIILHCFCICFCKMIHILHCFCMQLVVPPLSVLHKVSVQETLKTSSTWSSTIIRICKNIVTMQYKIHSQA